MLILYLAQHSGVEIDQIDRSASSAIVHYRENPQYDVARSAGRIYAIPGTNLENFFGRLQTRYV